MPSSPPMPPFCPPVARPGVYTVMNFYQADFGTNNLGGFGPDLYVSGKIASHELLYRNVGVDVFKKDAVDGSQSDFEAAEHLLVGFYEEFTTRKDLSVTSFFDKACRDVVILAYFECQQFDLRLTNTTEYIPDPAHMPTANPDLCTDAACASAFTPWNQQSQHTEGRLEDRTSWQCETVSIESAGGGVSRILFEFLKAGTSDAYAIKTKLTLHFLDWDRRPDQKGSDEGIWVPGPCPEDTAAAQGCIISYRTSSSEVAADPTKPGSELELKDPIEFPLTAFEYENVYEPNAANPNADKFAVVDTNTDGFIDTTELRAHLTRKGKNENAISALFSTLDINPRDNRLAPMEWMSDMQWELRSLSLVNMYETEVKVKNSLRPPGDDLCNANEACGNSVCAGQGEVCRGGKIESAFWPGTYQRFRPRKPGHGWDTPCQLEELQKLRQMNHPTGQTRTDFEAALEQVVPSTGSDIFLSSSYPYSEYISYANLEERVLTKNDRKGFPWNRIQPVDLSSNTFWDWACSADHAQESNFAARQQICAAALNERKRIEMRRSLSLSYAAHTSKFPIWFETTSYKGKHSGDDAWMDTTEYTLINHGVPPSTAVHEDFVGYWPSDEVSYKGSMGSYGRMARNVRFGILQDEAQRLFAAASCPV